MASTISAGTTSGTAIAIAGDTSGALALLTNNGTTAVTVTTAQNVGMGTDTPTAVTGFSTGRKVLQVTPSGGGSAQLRLGAASGAMLDQDDGGSTTTTLRNLYGATDATALVQIQSGYVTFGTGTSYTERMRINSSGTLLIGATTSPAGTQRLVLTANGSAGIEPMLFNELRSTAATENYVTFYRNGSQVGAITNTLSATAYVTSSDYRLKENIAPMTGALATVAQLKPVTYKWKATGENGQGFIAHELQALVPDCVSGEKDAIRIVDDVDEDGKVIGTKEVPQYQGIDTSFLVATLTAAIQELNAKVDAQATTIAELQARLPAENT
jgi:hypothetical protein